MTIGVGEATIPRGFSPSTEALEAALEATSGIEFCLGGVDVDPRSDVDC